MMNFMIMLLRNSVVLIVTVSLPSLFYVKMSITKSVLFRKYFCAYFASSWNKTFECLYCDMQSCIWVWFYLNIYCWCFPKSFEIIAVIRGLKETELYLVIFEFNCLLYRWIISNNNNGCFSSFKSCKTVIKKYF